mmetsp:Transcript_26780/g.90158  ORF Transcript_26780/g.90158 Transcript_26780/m.90158 type:complete len:201 (-) Transcript_26780:120-722(-)
MKTVLATGSPSSLSRAAFGLSPAAAFFTLDLRAGAAGVPAPVSWLTMTGRPSMSEPCRVSRALVASSAATNRTIAHPADLPRVVWISAFSTSPQAAKWSANCWSVVVKRRLRTCRLFPSTGAGSGFSTFGAFAAGAFFVDFLTGGGSEESSEFESRHAAASSKASRSAAMALAGMMITAPSLPCSFSFRYLPVAFSFRST